MAAVSVLCRTEKGRLEVFWARRAPGLAFLGGFWSFPGGRAEPGDASLEATAARELEEETGLVLPPAPGRYQPAGRTVTPAWAAIRFDATYFLVEAPPGAAPDVARSGGELVEAEWIEPARALELWASGERLTSPVVVAALEALVAGPDGAARRLIDAAEELGRRDAVRAWDLVPGLGMTVLRSPTIPPATHTNCFLVGNDELVVVDPGSPYPEEQRALDAAIARLADQGRRVREIWVTHHHIDHVGGVAHLARRWGAPVAAHPRTIELLEGRVRVDRALADGETVVFPGRPERRLRAVFTPGHTPGHHAFVEETTGFVLAGDMVAGVGTVVIDPDEGDMIAYLESLARLEAQAPRALLPAHGPVISDPAARLEGYRRHRLWRERRVVEELARLRDATARELTPLVYDDVPAEVHPLAERSLLAHLAKLVTERRVARDGDGRYAMVTSLDK
jgi:glyoxylase-like metal-dependent hydrolase (beta-lactamase superfamily II)/8-oxo-dGTP pyrophosphatase MutT (NUDIX family)